MEDKSEVDNLNRIQQLALVIEDIKKELEGKDSSVPKEDLPEYSITIFSLEISVLRC
ncbi:MAG: hypothetical protein KGD68_15610 [Candidatus Lokiarchaeota archaeon]|nr:hypothetical protein [Candidatus Lokiarchaeota archaeon]